MKLVKAIDVCGGYARFEVSGGNRKNCDGDMIWISECGTELEVRDDITERELKSLSKLFDSPKSFLGAFHRMTGW